MVVVVVVVVVVKSMKKVVGKGVNGAKDMGVMGEG